MVNYTKAVIYKIQHNENKSLCYIGSTCNFKTRKCQHKSNCYNTDSKSYNLQVYEMIRNNGGWACFNMIPIEEFPCETKTQLCIREEQVRVEYNANLNTRKAHTTAEDKPEYFKQYYIDNVDKLNQYSKQYYENNTDKSKQYYIDNRGKINEKATQYYDDIGKEKVTCECGCIVTNANLSRHKKSKKHLAYQSK